MSKAESQGLLVFLVHVMRYVVAPPSRGLARDESRLFRQQKRDRISRSFSTLANMTHVGHGSAGATR
jgi:hypothetical protein